MMIEVNGPFVHVLIQGDPKILQTWLSNPDHEKQINTHIVDGKTALSTAVMFSINAQSNWERNLRMQCVRLLLDKGADVHQLNQDGSSCFDLIFLVLGENPKGVALDKMARSQLAHLLDCLRLGRRERHFQINNLKLCDSAFIANLSRSD